MNIKELILRKRWKRKGVKLSAGTRLETETQIGYGTRVNGAIVVKGKAPCEIGRYCALGEEIRLITSNHSAGFANIQCSLQNRIGALDLETVRGSIRIGNNVWIGDCVTVVSGVSIGDGAVIGACSIVTRDIEPFGVAVGNPAKVKRLRFSREICEQLREIAWWNWPPDRIKRNREFFNLDLTTVGAGFDLGQWIVK